MTAAADDALLFISHHSGDSAAALRVEAVLRSRGVACWMAPRDVEPGEAFDEAIDRAIARCSAVLLLVSASAAESRHVKRELIIADNRHKMIIPLRLEAVEPAKLSYHLADSQWIDWDEGSDPVVDRIAARVRRATGSENAIAAPVPVSSVPAPAVPSSPRSPRQGGRRAVPALVWAAIGAVGAAAILVAAYLMFGGRSPTAAGTEAAAADPAQTAQLVLTPDRTSASEGDRMTFIVARPSGAPAQRLYFSLRDENGRPMRRGNIAIPGGGEPIDVPLEFRAGEEIQQVPLEIAADDDPDDGERFVAILQAKADGEELRRSTIVTVWDRGPG